MFLCIGLSLLLAIVSTEAAQSNFSFYDVSNAVPFNGSSLTSIGNGCTLTPGKLECNPGTKLDDGVIGGSISTDLGRYFAFNGASYMEFTLPSNINVSHIVLYFFNDPLSSIGLPMFSLTTTSDTVSFTFGNNNDLSMDDSTIRNVSLVVSSSTVTNFLKIAMSFSEDSIINWFLVSEVAVFDDGFSLPSLSPISFQDGGSYSISLGPPNALQVNHSITCTIEVSGLFKWVWFYDGNEITLSDNRYQILIGDATRSSILMISSLRYSDAGVYTCSARRQGENDLTNKTNELELRSILEPRSANISVTTGQTASLKCELLGYLSLANPVIQWMRGGAQIQPGGKYSIINSGGVKDSAINSQGGFRDSVLSELTISSIDASDGGIYTCLVESNTTVNLYVSVNALTSADVESTTTSGSTHDSTILSQPQAKTSNSLSVSSVPAITSTTSIPNKGTLSPSLEPSHSTTGTPVTFTTGLPITDPPTGQPSSSSSDTVVIIVVVVILVVVLLVFTTVVLLVVLTCHHRRLGNRIPSQDSTLKRVDVIPTETEPFYFEINQKPSKYTIVAPYSETELLSESSNGSIRGAVVSHIDSDPPMYQEIPEVPSRNPPTNNNRPINPKLLKENPMYSSADDLDQQLQMDTGFNIYAQPNMPPPIPDYNGTPDQSIYNESIYSVDLNPVHFRSQEDLAIGEAEQSVSPYLMPYSSIYSDPEPIAKNNIMEVNETHISEIKELGMGQFGRVVLAHTIGLTLKDLKLSNSESNVSILVAVKRLSEDADSKERLAFEKEIKFMARLRHENVVSLLGICLDRSAFIMMEYMENGDLNQYLQKFNLSPTRTSPSTAGRQDGSFLSPSVLIYMCLQIASGMRYLASLNFVHRDLAARNCLVGQKYIIKIADFGMSRKLYDRNYYRIQGKAILPIRWMSSECFYGRFSEKTDVWAFGVTMWEIFNFCNTQPFEDMSDQEVIDNAIKGADMILLKQPQACPDEIYEVMVKCWHHDPVQRTKFIDIHGYLSQIHAYNDDLN